MDEHSDDQVNMDVIMGVGMEVMFLPSAMERT